MPFFGIDISSSSIRVVRLKASKGGLIPSVLSEAVISETCSLFAGGTGAGDCGEVRSNLAALRKKHGIEFARVSVPAESVSVFRMEIPREALPRAEAFIRHSMEEQGPLKPQEVLFDYQILDSEARPPSVPALVTAVSRPVIEKYAALIESAGITVMSFEPETHAIARATVLRGDGDPYVIVNVGDRSTSVSVVEEGKVQHVLNLPIASVDMMDEIGQDAATVLRDGISKVIIHWFTSRDPQEQGTKIENIILTGESAHSANIVNFLESTLSVNAAFANVWKNCFDLNEYVPKVSRVESLRYAACIGLCLDENK